MSSMSVMTGTAVDDELDGFLATLPGYARDGVDPDLLARVAALEPRRRRRALRRLHTALVACSGDRRVCSAIIDAVAADG